MDPSLAKVHPQQKVKNFPESNLIPDQNSNPVAKEQSSVIEPKTYSKSEKTTTEVADQKSQYKKKTEEDKQERLNRKVSGFSLSSIALKKEAKKISQPKVIEENLPEESFEKSTLLQLWNEYAEKIKREGKQNIASIMRMREPDLKDPSTLLFTVANDMNKVEMKREADELLPFLRKQLNHYGIQIEFKITESIKEEAVFSAPEKYKHLVKINPALDTLRKKFDLDF